MNHREYVAYLRAAFEGYLDACVEDVIHAEGEEEAFGGISSRQEALEDFVGVWYKDILDASKTERKYEDDYAVFPSELADDTIHISLKMAAVWIGWREAVRRHLYKRIGLRTKVDDYITYCQGYCPGIEGFYGMDGYEAEQSYYKWCMGTLGI